MIKKIIVLMVLLTLLTFLLQAKQAARFPELQKPGTIVVDKNNILINDGVTIYIYSSKDFKLQTKFGKRGEGPGEFKTHPNIHRGGVGISIHPDYILVSSITRVTFFTRAGKYQRDVATRSILGHFFPLREKFVGTGIAQDSGGDYYTANIYNSNFEKEKEIFREKGIGRNKKLNAVALLKFPQLHVCGHKIFVNSDDGVIHVFDAAGEKHSAIELGKEKVKVTAAREKKYDDFYKTDKRFKQRYEDLKQIAEYPEYFPAIRNYFAADNKIYVVTYRQQDDKKELLTLDFEGNLLKKTFIPLKEMNVLELFPYTIYNGTIYQLVENPDSEEWELHTMDID